MCISFTRMSSVLIGPGCNGSSNISFGPSPLTQEKQYSRESSRDIGREKKKEKEKGERWEEIELGDGWYVYIYIRVCVYVIRVRGVGAAMEETRGGGRGGSGRWKGGTAAVVGCARVAARKKRSPCLLPILACFHMLPLKRKEFRRRWRKVEKMMNSGLDLFFGWLRGMTHNP